MKSRFSRQQLHDSLVHVRYTMDQLIVTAFWDQMESRLSFDGRPLTEQERAMYANACFDSSLCSLRVLDEFFGKPGKDLITAREYGFQEIELLDGPARRRINNHVSHLTHRRAEEPILEFANRLILSAFPTCTDFLDHLVASFLKPDDAEMAPISKRLDGFRSARKRFQI